MADSVLKLSKQLPGLCEATSYPIPAIHLCVYLPTTAVRAGLDDGLARLSVDSEIVNVASLKRLGSTKKRGSGLGTQDRRSDLRGAGSNEANHLDCCCSSSRLCDALFGEVKRV